MSDFGRDARRGEDCLSDLQLDRLRVGELRGTEAETVAAHLGACGRCSERRAVLEADARQFGEQQFVAGLAQQALSASRRAPSRWRVMAAASSAVAAAGLLLMLTRVPPQPEDASRVKGGAFSMEVLARRVGAHNAEMVLDGERLAAGDAIRFQLSTDRAGNAAVIGLDAAGQVTPYAPAVGNATPLTAGPKQLLEGSVILDATAGAERLVALICDRPVAVDAVVQAGRRALAAAKGDPRKVGALDLEGCRQSSLIFEKARPR